MVLDPRARRLIDMLALSGPAGLERQSTAERRKNFSSLMNMSARPVNIARVENITVNGPGGPLSMRLYSPHMVNKVSQPALVFLHGGGLVAGDLETHDGICRHLANASSAVVIAVNYRLAPEAKFPAALIDAAFALEYVAREAAAFGIDRSRLAIGGESAGALLATLITSGHHAVEVPLVAQLLLCPVIDLCGQMASRREFGQGYLIDTKTVERDIEDCLPPNADSSILPSPLTSAKLMSSPPTIIVAAECDPFRDEAELYANRLIASAVPVRYNCHAGMIHSFYGLSALLPQADPALHAAGRELAALLA